MTIQRVGYREPVVPKVKLERVPFDPAAKVRDAVSFFEVPEQRLKPLASASNKFKPAVDTYWLNKVRKKMITGVIITGSVDALVSTAVGLPVGLAVPASVPILLGIWSILQVSFLPFGVMYSRVHRAEKRNFHSFLLWAKARYNVTFSAKQGISRYLRKNSRYDDLRVTDAKGALVKIVSYEGLYLTDRNSGEELGKSAQVNAPKKVKAAAAQLSPEAKGLFDQINEHLDVLGERSLSPESDHVVSRAARDRDAVVALHADLVRLNGLDEEQKQDIVNSFSTLLKELAEVVRRETKFALAALNVENMYITSREEPAGIALEK
jgi:hypothetical protein